METTVYFEDIQHHITHQLEKAQFSIRVAVAWFTDPVLFERLITAQNRGVSVEVLLSNDEINQGEYGLDFSTFEAAGGQLFWVGSNGMHDRLMHNKFCLIDNEVVINGSYNWTRKAQHNNENITIIAHSPQTIRQFGNEFERIKRIATGAAEPTVDSGRILIRLEKLEAAFRMQNEVDPKKRFAELLKSAKSINLQKQRLWLKSNANDFMSEFF